MEQEDTKVCVVLGQSGIKRKKIAASMIMNLPLDMVFQILSWLPAIDLVRCRCVCKSWHRLSKETSFLDLHFSRSSARQKGRDLLLWDDNRVYLMSKKSNGEWDNNRVSTGNLNITEIASSCNGLLCALTKTSSGEEDLVLYNPITKDRLTLPRANNGFDAYRVIGVDQINKKYIVIHTKVEQPFYRKKDVFEIEILTVGESSWRKLLFPYEVETLAGPFYLNGSFYWLTGEHCGFNKILVMDITSEEVHVVKVSNSTGPLGSHMWLVELDNSLGLVQYNNSEFRTWKTVFNKIDGSCHCHEISTSNMITDTDLLRTLDLDLNQLVGYSSLDQLVGELGDGCLAMKIFSPFTPDPKNRAVENFSISLILYNPEHKQTSLLKLDGMGIEYLGVQLFEPSLISPSYL